MNGRDAGVPADATLLRRAARALFWNASLLPFITVINLAAAVLIRRGFGLESGAYDVALGLVNTLLAHAGLGVPMTIGQFVPALERSAGAQAVRGFVTRVGAVRLALLLIVLAPLNLYAGAAADALALGPSGATLVRIVTVLALVRACSDLAIKALQAVLAHLLANLVQLAQALVLVGAAAITLSTAGSIPSLLATLTAFAVVVAAGAAWMAWLAIGQAASRPAQAAQPASPEAAGEAPRWPVVWRFAMFMYTFEASNYFATPAFASVALALFLGAQGTIAVFNVAFQVPLMIVTVLLAGFQGLYRPLFAAVIAERHPERLQTAFAEISKVQTALLVPAGLGLALLMPDVIALLFTNEFAAAAPLARVLCGLLFAESLFNLGTIILSVDRRYGLTMATQAMRIAGAPAFVWFAVRGDLLAATAAFGAGRLLASALGFVIARRLYGVRYPWGFTTRVVLASLPMAVVVALGRQWLPAGWLSTLTLALAGAALTLAGARLFRVLGEREARLLQHAGIPGGAAVARLLAPRAGEAQC